MKGLLLGAMTFVAAFAARAADRYAAYDDHATAGMTKVAGQEYVNNNYGYSVRLPDGQVAWMNAAPSPNHGFRIFLGPRRSIEVDASFDSAFLGSASAVADDAAESLPSGKSVKSDDELGGKHAVRVVVEGPDERRRIILANWVEVEKDDDINYEISLETTKPSFEQDERVFASVAKSFKYLTSGPPKGKPGVGGALLAAPYLAKGAIAPTQKESTPPK